MKTQIHSDFRFGKYCTVTSSVYSAGLGLHEIAVFRSVSSPTSSLEYSLCVCVCVCFVWELHYCAADTAIHQQNKQIKRQKPVSKIGEEREINVG